MKISIDHTTQFTFETAPSFGLQRLLMRPQDGPTQKVLAWDIRFEHATSELTYTDHFGNLADLVKTQADAQSVHLRVTGIVETIDTAGIVGTERQSLPHWIFKYETALTEPHKSLRAFISKLKAPEDNVAYFHILSDQIRSHVDFSVESTLPSTTASEAWEIGAGVCQDHTHIMLSCARALGFPARYVSGYLLMNDRTDQAAMHAWSEIYFADIGWVGFDVANGYSPDERYIRTAIGRDYNDAQPTRGIRYGSGAEKLEVSLQIQQ